MDSFPFSEMWEYYFLQHDHKKAPKEYFGGKNAQNNIESLLQAASTLYSSLYPQKLVEYHDIDPLKSQLYFIGDIHGSFSSLHRIVSFGIKIINSAVSGKRAVKMVFLGDYVDRDPDDLHCLIFLLLFNLKYPHNVLLLRGNHEEISLNQQYGFRQTVLRRFSKAMYGQISQFFGKLPLIAIFSINASFSIISMHGGVPANWDDLEKPVLIRKTPLLSNVPSILDMDAISQQILWNDPSESLPISVDFYPNRYRGGTFYEFSSYAFHQFMQANNFDLMVRGHQMFNNGYRFYFNQKLLSLFSTVEYCGMKVDGKIAKITFSFENPKGTSTHKENEANNEKIEIETYLQIKENLNVEENSKIEEKGADEIIEIIEIKKINANIELLPLNKLT